MRALLAILLAPGLSAGTVSLGVEPGSSSRLEYRTELGVATSHTNFGGELIADITLDAVTGQPSAFSFTGGKLTYSDSTTNYVSYNQPQTERLTLESRGTAATLASLVAEPSVDAGNGALANEEHTLTLDEGTLRVLYERTIVGTWFVFADTEQDFTVDPATTSITGTTAIHLINQWENVLGRESTFRLVHEGDPTPQSVNAYGLPLTTVTTGGFTASGSAFEPSAGYASWSGDSGISSASKHPSTGASLGILYAMGLAPEDSIPLAIEGSEARVGFPAGGSRGEMVVEFSDNLQDWQALPIASGESVLTAFPPGTSGDQRVPLPADSGFVRLRVP